MTGVETAPVITVMPQIHPDVQWLFWLVVGVLLTIFMLNLGAAANRMSLRLYLLYLWTKARI